MHAVHVPGAARRCRSGEFPSTCAERTGQNDGRWAASRCRNTPRQRSRGGARKCSYLTMKEAIPHLAARRAEKAALLPRAAQLAGEGRSYQEIADALGIAKSTVCQWLRAVAWTRRRQGPGHPADEGGTRKAREREKGKSGEGETRRHGEGAVVKAGNCPHPRPLSRDHGYMVPGEGSCWPFGRENADAHFRLSKTTLSAKKGANSSRKAGPADCGRWESPEIRNAELYKKAGSNVLIRCG